LIFKETFQGKTEINFLGVENFIFIGLGKVFLVPILNESYFDNEDDQNILNSYRQEKISMGNIPYTLFQHYIRNEPNILVKKFPTKL
jgi:hypothetical protein